jgi:hypothetical protein
MTYTKMASAALAMAAIVTFGAATPAIAGADDHIVNAAASASYGDQYDDGEPAGGTGVDPGPAAPPDTPSGPGLADGGEPAGVIG